jgi:hypothetical protein
MFAKARTKRSSSFASVPHWRGSRGVHWLLVGTHREFYAP